jgi:hypothetical protein
LVIRGEQVSVLGEIGLLEAKFGDHVCPFFGQIFSRILRFAVVCVRFLRYEVAVGGLGIRSIRFTAVGVQGLVSRVPQVG